MTYTVLLYNRLSLFSTQIYFNNFHQCEYNCKKVKQIVNLYSHLLTSEIINQLAKKNLNKKQKKNNKQTERN